MGVAQQEEVSKGASVGERESRRVRCTGVPSVLSCIKTLNTDHED